MLNLKNLFEALKKSPVTSEVATSALHAIEASGQAFLNDIKTHLPGNNTVQGLAVQAIIAAASSAITKAQEQG
jgi:hypothetical protein